MIEVLEPQNALLKRFVDSIYILKEGEGSLEFTAYPSTNTPVALFRNVAVSIKEGNVLIERSATDNQFVLVCSQLSSSLHLRYPQLVDEIAINFKPLGFFSFTQLTPNDEQIDRFDKWDQFLPALFNIVFATEDRQQQLHYIEQFLLGQYIPSPNEAIVLKALELLNDRTKDYKMQEIADLAGVHHKTLYRYFTESVGCSPVHYRKLVKFRTSVVSKLKTGDKARLVDICYDNDYTDQSYFIKQFKELTGERPKLFFKGITSYGNDKVIFKID